MATRKFSIIFFVGILLVSLLCNCSKPAPSTQPPEQVVESFYRWYLGYPGNPLVDRAYRENDLLAESYIQEIDALLASLDGGHFDPFLMAQDIPVKVEVMETFLSGNTAMVTLQQWWGGNDVPRNILIELELSEEGWLIAGITIPETGLIEPSPIVTQPAAAPDQVAASYYAWYLEYIGERGSDHLRNPLVDGAFARTDFLADDFIQQVDELLASFDKGGYDPILCAQDIPEYVNVGEPDISDGKAIVNVNSSFANHDWMVELAEKDGRWLIVDINCGGSHDRPESLTPEKVVEDFYNWYLSYIGDRNSDDFRNPLADGAYKENNLLSPELIKEVEAIRDKYGYFPADPFLCAQDIPQEIFIVGANVTGERANVTVGTSFDGHSFAVGLVMMDGQWRITSIDCQSGQQREPDAALAGADIPAGWQTWLDEGHGFQLAMPSDWDSMEIELRYPELDAPVVRMVHLAPAGIIAQMQQSGPPDPNVVVVAPLAVEVIEGTIDAYHERNGEPDASEVIEINGISVVKEIDVPGDFHLIRYVFQHPNNPELTVMLVDQYSGFSIRIEGNEEIIEKVNRIIGTFRFTR
ncbi:MAG: DUF3828 domain-containing protein [Anaerolineales bacterium]|nr:DUF3828 domain-containing protein [Anaerolineales bacterium]